MKMASIQLQNKIRELSKITYKAVTILERCKSCGTCVKFCPLNLRILNDDGKAITITSTSLCGGCSVCFHRCPNHAINLKIVFLETIQD